jgi:hypothetical protein
MQIPSNIDLRVLDYFTPKQASDVSANTLPLSYSAREKLQPAWTHDDDVFLSTQCEAISLIATSCAETFNPKINKSYLLPSPRTEWIYDIIMRKVQEANELLYGYELWGIAEPLIFQRFNNTLPSWHARSDQFANGPVKKLTFILQLSADTLYKGSDIQLIYGDNRIESLPKKQGSLSIFPSHMVYGIDNPSEGSHDILIGYFTGKEFK